MIGLNKHDRIVVGIDPDARAHGLAVYVNGKLAQLDSMDTPTIITRVTELGFKDIRFSIEDAKASTFIYRRNDKANKQLQAKVGLSVGRCQQAQVELMRWLDHYGIAYELHKPQAGNWAKNKAQFEKVTGWMGSSNEDNRSAAYFGFIAL